MINVRPNFILLQNEVRKNSSTYGVVKRSDLWNYKTKNQSNLSGATDLEKMMSQLMKVDGATVKVSHNKFNELEAIYFQEQISKVIPI